MNYYSFHIGDYAKRTRYLTIFQDLAYRRLLDEYYIKETQLVGTPEKLAGEIGMADHVGAVVAVLEQFFQKTEGGWCNDRCEEEIGRLKKSAEQARENGRKSAGRPKKTTKNPAGTPVDTQPVAISVPSGIPPAPPAGTGLPTTQYPIPITHNSATNVAGAEAPIPQRIGDAIDPVPSRFPDDGPPPHPLPETLEEAYGSGPPPASDEPEVPIGKQLWDLGLSCLVRQGDMAEPAARRAFGKFVRDMASDVELLRIVKACVDAGSQDPMSFLRAGVDLAKGKRVDRNGNRAVGKLPPREAYRNNPDDRGNPDVPF